MSDDKSAFPQSCLCSDGMKLVVGLFTTVC